MKFEVNNNNNIREYDQFIASNVPNWAFISEETGLSITRIKNRWSRIKPPGKIFDKRKHWTSEEDNILIDNWFDLNKAAELTGSTRRSCRVRRERLEDLGLKPMTEAYKLAICKPWGKPIRGGFVYGDGRGNI